MTETKVNIMGYPLDGFVIEYPLDGKIKEEGEYVNGKRVIKTLPEAKKTLEGAKKALEKAKKENMIGEEEYLKQKKGLEKIEKELMIAEKKRIAKQLQEKGADINAKDPNKQDTAMAMARANRLKKDR